MQERVKNNLIFSAPTQNAGSNALFLLKIAPSAINANKGHNVNNTFCIVFAPRKIVIIYNIVTLAKLPTDIVNIKANSKNDKNKKFSHFKPQLFLFYNARYNFYVNKALFINFINQYTFDNSVNLPEPS
ncbi:Uncharacterised protein [Proteus mirabilis]|uniref:Uncharacterized protein n=1 Tax=Proteus mirabilis TaxID=584 RepID=A0A2X2BNX9_PROMI|nr:Uncharacterised protein [Proteus mirabilis]